MRKIFEKIKFFNKSKFYIEGDYIAFKNLLKGSEKIGDLERDN